uniref:J domain-containing protein n=1 Tax=Dicentrarchus labrax TaxID=13489 RepID=A0A8C4I3P9_DICLA
LATAQTFLTLTTVKNKVKYRIFSPLKSEPLYKTKTGYYEILEVTPTATQGQIKAAYYKQSFVYHPDRNAGSDEATLRFSEISEAYTVLGNKTLRKKYDLGLLSLADLVAVARPSAKDTTGSSAKQQTGGRRSAADPNSLGGIFDFDKFFKAHYTEQLQREREFRARKEEMLRKKQEKTEDGNLSKISQVGILMMLAMAVAVLISLK